MTTTTQLALTHLVEGQASAELTVNDAVNKLDATIHLSVIDRDLTAPPGSPTEGDRYIPKATASGDWTGHENKIAVYLSGWVILTPKEGWTTWVNDENVELVYTGAAWEGCSTTATLTASTTQTQAGGTAITTEVTKVSTVGSTDDTVTLPAAYPGRRIFIYNTGANRLQIFPASGDAIGSASVDAANTVNANRSFHYIALDATTWAPA